MHHGHRIDAGLPLRTTAPNVGGIFVARIQRVRKQPIIVRLIHDDRLADLAQVAHAVGIFRSGFGARENRE